MDQATQTAFFDELEKIAADMPPFLDQDRPKKVKEIYKALKRAHPDMPAERKARIAARQGKKGKQHQGPPYKGPLTKESASKSRAATTLFRMISPASREAMQTGTKTVKKRGGSGLQGLLKKRIKGKSSAPFEYNRSGQIVRVNV